jgi:sulfotransferase family protein
VKAKLALNAALRRSTGYELRRSGQRRRIRGVGPRLVTAPAFVLCPTRSGSTLLRVLLDSHSQILSPQELHLRDIDVTIGSEYSGRALRESGLDERTLRFLLWDRILHRELEESGKRIIVNKTPNDVLIASDILECWPDARFIFLLRHPGAIARSRQATRAADSPAKNAKVVRLYGDALEKARHQYPGLTVRYEELAAEPERVTRELCAFLGVPWERSMVDYGRFDHGRYRVGLGDWKEKIRSGQVQPPESPPPVEEIHPSLLSLCRAWGYLPALEPAAEPPAPAHTA